MTTTLINTRNKFATGVNVFELPNGRRSELLDTLHAGALASIAAVVARIRALTDTGVDERHLYEVVEVARFDLQQIAVDTPVHAPAE